MDTDTEVKRVVRERYASAAVTSRQCCGAAAGKGLAQSDLGLDAAAVAREGARQL